MNRLRRWWDTSCDCCLKTRRLILDASKLIGSLLVIVLLPLSGLFFYWILLDNQPAILYGPNGRAEFVNDHITFYLDATRLRACPTEIQRKITGCGQIDLLMSFATTPVGQKAAPYSIELKHIFQSFTKEQLSGNVCSLVSQATSYCNPAQRLLKIPIIVQSPPIQFIPVPRSKTYPADQP